MNIKTKIGKKQKKKMIESIILLENLEYLFVAFQLTSFLRFEWYYYIEIVRKSKNFFNNQDFFHVLRNSLYQIRHKIKSKKK